MTERPTAMTGPAFMARFGGVFEHSPWVAEAALRAGLPPEADAVEGLHRALVGAMRAGSRDQQLALICAHPDLAGRLATAGRLTASSTAEQASAGLDRLTDDERTRFTALNAQYVTRFGFPFIMAVKGRRKDEILAAFHERLSHDPEAEHETALSEIEKIVLFRLRDLLPSQ